MKLFFLAGADSIHSYRWVRFFADRGHETHWVSLVPLSVGELLSNVHFYKIDNACSKAVQLTKAVFYAKRLIKEVKPDILHSHYAGTYGVIGALSGFHSTIVTAWGSDILLAGRSVLKRPLIKYVLNDAKVITCDADHMVEAMAGLGIKLNKIKVIYFGTDTERFKPREKDELLLKGLKVFGSPTIISLRSLDLIYDVESLVRAVPLVHKEVLDAKFIIVGKGPEADRLEKLTRSLGKSDSIRFIGSIPNKDLPGYLSSVDIYVSTSLSDAGLSASTAEAMACGLPVVVTKSGENSKWIKNGENGFVVPLSNPEALAEKIVFFLKNQEARQRCGEAARQLIKNKNNYQIEMNKIEKLYKTVKQGMEP